MKNFALTAIRHWPMILVSLLLSSFIWIFAVTSSDPTEDGMFSQSVVVKLEGLGEDMVLTSDLPYTVSINMRAPSSIWRRISLEKVNAVAQIDVTGLGPGEYELPISVDIGIKPVQILSFTPQTVDITLEKYESRDYPVRVHEKGEISAAFKAEKPVLSQDTVTISGPVSLLDQIDSARVTIDRAGRTESLEQSSQVTPINADGQVVRGDLMVTPEKISVRQDITLRGGYRVLSVKLITNGDIPKGFRVKKIGVDPAFVTVYSADQNLLDKLNSYAETESVNLSEIESSISQKISLKVPDGVTMVGDPTVNLTVDVEAVEGTSTLTNIPVYAIGVDAGLGAVFSPDVVDVYLEGPVNSLDNISTKDLFAVIELQDLGVGSYQIEPRVEINSTDNIRVQSISPSTIEVQIDHQKDGEE